MSESSNRRGFLRHASLPAPLLPVLVHRLPFSDGVQQIQALGKPDEFKYEVNYPSNSEASWVVFRDFAGESIGQTCSRLASMASMASGHAV